MPNPQEIRPCEKVLVLKLTTMILGGVTLWLPFDSQGRRFLCHQINVPQRLRGSTSTMSTSGFDDLLPGSLTDGSGVGFLRVFLLNWLLKGGKGYKLGPQKKTYEISRGYKCYISTSFRGGNKKPSVKTIYL